jgi:2-methylcitrate dehydratase PrpD
MLTSPAGAPATPHAAEFARTFADFSASLQGRDLPSDVVRTAKANLFDTLACAIAGSNAPGVAEVRELAVSWGGAPQAPVWCSQWRLPAHHVAWVNGMMAHARDFDDTHDAAVLHAGVSVVPAALAAAALRPEATGDDLLAGIVAGLELVCRLGVATTIGIIESGFIYTSLFGYFGATVAAARVLGLDARQTVNAIGIAYSQAAGTHQVTRDAALTKRMQPGFAAKAALVSVQLAQREIRGAQNTFDGVDGLFRTYLRDGYDPQVLREGLGRRFELTELSYKPYPCCRFNHTAIDAAVAVRRQPGFDLSRIGRITAGVNHQAYQAVCTPPDIRRHPTTGVQAQFSIPFTVACALVDGRVSLNHFTDQGLRRPDILALAAKVECSVDDDIEKHWSRSISPTELVVEVGSTTFRQRADYPRGHTRFPMTTADFDSKLDDCMAFSALNWPPDTAAKLREMISGLEHLRQAREINAILTFGAIPPDAGDR